MFNFEKLIVYQKSIKLSIALCKIASEFTSSHKRIADQLIGAVMSIALNIAEGSGRRSNKEKIQFYRVAQSSAFELVAILDICNGINLISKSEWVGEIEAICKMLSSLINKLKTNN